MLLKLWLNIFSWTFILLVFFRLFVDSKPLLMAAFDIIAPDRPLHITLFSIFIWCAWMVFHSIPSSLFSISTNQINKYTLITIKKANKTCFFCVASGKIFAGFCKLWRSTELYTHINLTKSTAFLLQIILNVWLKSTQ